MAVKVINRAGAIIKSTAAKSCCFLVAEEGVDAKNFQVFRVVGQERRGQVADKVGIRISGQQEVQREDRIRDVRVAVVVRVVALPLSRIEFVPR